jgi:hypothetical protein
MNDDLLIMLGGIFKWVFHHRHGWCFVMAYWQVTDDYRSIAKDADEFSVKRNVQLTKRAYLFWQPFT